MEKLKTRIGRFHDKNYKKLLIIPAAILILCIIYMGIFYSQNGDFMLKDISLTGGTSVTIYGDFDSQKLIADLSSKLENFNIRDIYDLSTQEKEAVIIETSSEGDYTLEVLEEYLEYSLDSSNSSFESTGSSLSESFYIQLALAIIIAFTFMGWVVFLLFGNKLNLKILTGILVIVNAILSFSVYGPTFSIIASLIILAITFVIYLFYSVPSAAVIISAFADIFMTLTLVNLLGIKMSTAGIVAFLMLIGYSVDTDILLTNRLLRKDTGSTNNKIFSSFKTGMTMSLTSFFAILTALIIVQSFSPVLTKIFTIIVIGLALDIFNTWITNVSILKWYFEEKK
jgi:preprotein translocase subunit SecF